MEYSTEVQQAIADLKRTDPRLYRAIELLNQQLFHISRIIEPIEARSQLQEEEEVTPVDSPVVAYAFTKNSVRFAWLPISGAVFYEVRKGTSWDTALFQFRTSNLGADIDPILVGSHTYLFKSVNVGGIYSASAYVLTVTVPPMGVVGLIPQVIDNNVLIDWVEPFSTFEIDRYNVYKDGVYLSFVRGSFFTRVEPVSGSYTYKVIAVDLAGNTSPDSSILLIVAQPPDYVLQDQRMSQFTGTIVNMVKTAGIASPNLIGPVDTSRTWAQHFEDNLWTTIEQQINAGFPIYGTPSYTAGTPDGYYEEEFDYGVLFTAVIATATWSFNQFFTSNPVNVVVKMWKSTDGISWTGPTLGASQFIVNMRYLRIRLEFEAPTNKSLMEIYNLKISLAVKREMDGGFATAFASDTLGTVVTFNKAFKDIDSITVSLKSAKEPMDVIFDFQDIPNPVNFKVLVYDFAGNRVTKDVEWKARGII